MKAINVSVGFDERKKVDGFVYDVEDEETFIYQIDEVQMVIVTEGECSMAYVKGKLEEVFDDPTIDGLR